MRKIKFYLDAGFAGANYEDTIEYDDNVSDFEIEDDLNEWMEERISYWWEENE